MIHWLPLFLLHEEEQQKKRNDPNYVSPYDIDITEIRGGDVLIGILIGISPFLLAFGIIAIKKYIFS